LRIVARLPLTLMMPSGACQIAQHHRRIDDRQRRLGFRRRAAQDVQLPASSTIKWSPVSPAWQSA
jgi:hypothetical protein